jgi:hypothetical protein
MTTRFISLATGIVLLDVFLRSQLSSNDPLFLFASNNIVVNAGLLIIVALMVAVSFSRQFKRWWTFAACAAVAVVFGAIGFAGTFFSEVFYYFPQTLLQLDYMFLMEASVVFGVAALSYKHAPLPSKLRLPAVSLPKFEFPVPKIPHSPSGGINRPLGTRNS